MKQFGDFLPVLVFFVVYMATRDIILATAVLVGATIVQLAVIWQLKRVIEKPLLYASLAVIVLGGMTVALRDPVYVKLKPTVVNWTIAAVLIVSQLFAREPLVKKLLTGLISRAGGVTLNMPEPLWRSLNLWWIGFFLFVGCTNLFVAHRFDEATWVNFRLFGLMGLNALFFIAQFVWLSRYMSDDSPAA